MTFEEYFHWTLNSGLSVFSFHHLQNAPFSSGLHSFWQEICYHSGCFCITLLSWYGFLWFILFVIHSHLESVGLCLFSNLESFQPLFLQILFLSSPLVGYLFIHILDRLKLFHNSLGICSFFQKFLCFVCASFWMVSIALSSCSLIFISAMSNVLLIPSCAISCPTV